MAADIYLPMRAQLQEERERVVDQLSRLGYGPEGRMSFDEGFADSGQVTAERGEVDALATALLESLQEVDDALKKLENGSYGRCESCGGEIAVARLEAMPTARECINCASKNK